MTIYNVLILTNIVTQVVGGGGRRVAFKLSASIQLRSYALCLGKNSEEREGKGGGGGEPVDKHLRLLFHPLVIILPIICQ